MTVYSEPDYLLVQTVL